MKSTTASLENRFRGCLLGLALGDAIGRYWEGVPAEWIVQQHADETSLLAVLPSELRYTDDTQMTIGVAETLVACGTIDQQMLVSRFAAYYEPCRGYGSGAHRIFELWKSGVDWKTAASQLFGSGSYGNGGAMRVAPVGLFFHGDLDSVWENAGHSARVTHAHPLGIEGAQLLATTVSLCVKGAGEFSDEELFRVLSARCTTDEYRRKVDLASRVKSIHDLCALGNGIQAHESVVAAIACFCLFRDSYVATIGQAILLGGDTDTIAAMAGACAGAYLGIDGLPANFVNSLENGPHGRDYIDELAKQLCSKRGGSSVQP